MIYACYPHRHIGLTSRTSTIASHALRPITSVRIRNRAVTSGFMSPSYSLRGSCFHSVFHTAARRPREVLSHRVRHSFSIQRLVWALSSPGGSGSARFTRRAGVAPVFRLRWRSVSSCLRASSIFTIARAAVTSRPILGLA